jgi:hypothetical protein
MMDNDEAFWFVLAVFSAWTVGWFMGSKSEGHVWEEDAVKKGHAEYNPQTGEWRWKETK